MLLPLWIPTPPTVTDIILPELSSYSPPNPSSFQFSTNTLNPDSRAHVNLIPNKIIVDIYHRETNTYIRKTMSDWQGLIKVYGFQEGVKHNLHAYDAEQKYEDDFIGAMLPAPNDLL